MKTGFFTSLSGTLRNTDMNYTCLLYTSDAADDLLCVDLGGRRIIKKKHRTHAQKRKEKMLPKQREVKKRGVAGT